MESLPINNSGKIDRKKLQSDINTFISSEDGNEDYSEVKDSTASVPQTYAESSILQIAREILNDNTLTVETDLFEAGMNSLDVMTLVGKINSLGLAETTVAQVYEHHAISKFAGKKRESFRWITPYSESKPVFVMIPGYTELNMSEILKPLKQNFSILCFQPFYDFFYQKEVKIEEILNHYAEIVTPLLYSNKVFVSGFCTGAEMAILLMENILKQNPDVPLPIIVNMEGIFKREKESIAELKDNDPVSDKLRIAIPLNNQIERWKYDGPIIHFFASQITYKPFQWDEEVKDASHRQKIETRFKQNQEQWLSHFTNAPFYFIDKDHWSFLCEETITFIADKIKEYIK
ncbi:MAG: acyl carrier protein [Bacteroidales bacterium]|nr:acyl carrier protein [Bacteroidales bacterium]